MATGAASVTVSRFTEDPTKASRVAPSLELFPSFAKIISATTGNYLAREEWNATIDPYPEFDDIPDSRLPISTIYEEDTTLTVGSNPLLLCVAGFSFSYPLRTPANNKSHPHCKGLKSGRAKGWHAGIDMYIGDQAILAPYAGTVTFSGEIGGYGKRVEILLDGVELYVHFCHLTTRLVKAGDRVEKGDKIGIQGNTGCGECGVHLHLEVADARAIGVVKTGTTNLTGYGTGYKQWAAGVLCNPWYAFDMKALHKIKKK